MNNLKKTLVFLLSLVMVFSLAACGGKGTAANNTTGNASPENNSGTNEGENREPSYSYNLAIGTTPVNWNPHVWETDADITLLNYLTPGLVDISIADDGVNFEWVYEMATDVEDITGSFEAKADWGIEEGETGRVYKISLNKDAKWEDGTPINAESYVYSMQQLLNPEMNNYRARNYCTGSAAAIENALSYMYSGKINRQENMAGEAYSMDDLTLGEDGIYKTPDGLNVYIAIDHSLATWLDGDTLADYIDAFGDAYFDLSNWDALVALEDADGLVPLTEESYKLFVPVTTGNPAWGETKDDIPAYFVYDVQYDECSWDKVGLWAEDEYTLIWVNEAPVTEFYFLSNLTSNWLIYKDLYDAGKSTTNGVVSTCYATGLDTSISCGPYKLVNFEADKQCVLEKNENWYGWTDGKHDGQYQTTRIVYSVIADEKTQEELFLKGELDELNLTSGLLSTYRTSDNLLKTDETYTYRWIFATDLDALKALEDEANDGANKRVLAYDDFRKAISLSMDRAKFCAEGTAAYKPAYYLLNYLYYYDIENDPESLYRNTTEAKEAVLDLYGIEYGEGKTYASADEAYNAVTGYDPEAAREIFQSVYEKAVEDGNYIDGQEIRINCMCSVSPALSSDEQLQEKLLNDMVAEAAAGTGFEGKIKFTFKSGAADRYGDVAAGKVEMINGAWGGEPFDPFKTIKTYCSPSYMGGLMNINESCGWDPEKEMLDITADFDGDGTEETLTKSFAYWADAINDANYYASDRALCVTILSRLENGVLGAYQCIPWAIKTSTKLYSDKIEHATTDYNIMYGYGGIRLMKYNYSDEEWTSYVETQNGQLSY